VRPRRPAHTGPGELDARLEDRVDWLSKWFDDQTSTPTGSILLFLLVFLVRITLDTWARKRENERKTRKEVLKRHVSRG
jgi:hypothetical protein